MKIRTLLRAHLLPALLSLLAPAIAMAQEADKPLNYVIGVPSAMQSEEGVRCLKTAAEILLQEPAGGVVYMYDATTGEDLGRPVTIPSGNQKRRLRAVAPAIKAWNIALRKRFSEDAQKLNVIRLPQFMDVVARIPRPCRLFVLGDWRYRDARDASGVWPLRYTPSDDFIAARRIDSVYGCADRGDQLEGVRVYFSVRGAASASGEDEREAKRFWARFVNAQSGRLVLWSDVLETALREFLAGSDVLAEKSLRLEPRGALAMVENTVRKRVLVTDTPKIRVWIETDGSISSGSRLVIERVTYPRLLREWAVAPATIEVGIGVFRGTGSHDTAPVAELELDGRGQPTAPLAGLERFITSKDVEASVAEFAPGSESGSRTGQKIKVSRMEPLGASVDTAFGLRESLRVLSELRPMDVPVLVFCGDCDTSERFSGAAIAVENKRLVDEVAAFARMYPNARVVSLFTGRKASRDEAFFRDVAAAAGKRGVFLDRPEQLESTLRTVVKDAQKLVVQR